MIIYLHGFSSAAASHKATLLQQQLSQYNFLVPEYPSYQPGASIDYLTAYIEEKSRKHDNKQVMLIGSSLGGFYAQYLSVQLDEVTTAVLINPALQPQITLKPKLGQQTNMVTGEKFIFRQQGFDELQQFEVLTDDIAVPTLVLLDEGDEIIDYRFAVRQFKNSGRVIVYPGGGHRFDHLEEAMQEIVAFYKAHNSV